ncbi:MAG: serine hydrolase domain-containing protein, partial [bacterium]
MASRFLRLQILFIFFFLSPSLLPAQLKNLKANLKEIDEYAAKAGQDWRVPGFAMAIVKDDSVVFAKGYGVRELGKPTSVDARTLFAIASNSKAFTAAALAILVDEGKIKWDDPVTKYLPWFQMYDPYVTREMMVRDLLCHRSGLATFGGDLIWYGSTYSREEVVRRIRYLKPASSFRTRYGYQNIMFIAAGLVVEAVTGKSWDDFVKARFFAPLGMTTSNTSVKDFKGTDNFATPHNETDGKINVIHYVNVDGIGAAGAINSCVAEMAQWLRLQLGRGTYKGNKIFSAARSREMWTPHIMFQIGEQAEKQNPTTHFSGYGLGWGLRDYQGRKVASHGGGLDGMISQVALIPEENLGVVVLTNSETSLSSFLVNKVFDVFLGAPKRDWSGEALARQKENQEAQKAAAKRIEDERVPGTKPSLALGQYTGMY